jgi:hypothetical protein
MCLVPNGYGQELSAIGGARDIPNGPGYHKVFWLASSALLHVQCTMRPRTNQRCLSGAPKYAALRSARPAATNPACWLQGVWIARDCCEVRESPALHEVQACWLGTWTENCACSCWTVNLDREPGPSEVDLVETTSCGAVQSVIKQLARARLLDRDAPRSNTVPHQASRLVSQPRNAP